MSSLSRPGGVRREAGVREPGASCSPVLRSQDCPPGGQTCASQGQRCPEASCGRCPPRCGHPVSQEGRGHLQRPQHVGHRALWGGGRQPPHNRDKDFKSARTWRICGFTGLCGWGAGQAAWGPRLGGTAALGRQHPRPRAGPAPRPCRQGGPLAGGLCDGASSPPARSPEARLPSRCLLPALSGVPGARPGPVCWSLPQRAAFFKSLLRVWK